MKICWLVLFLLCFDSAAHADRDIVYAARYYAPPGSHKTSHFHLYRINPDGTGKTQLTFGNTDDGIPRWIANGKQITFITYPAASSTATLCRIDANGKNRRVVKVLGEGETVPGPVTPGYRLDNVYPVLPDGSDMKHFLVDTRTGHRLLLTVPVHDDYNDVLFPMPGGLVYGANNHNSTVGTDYAFYRLNPQAGAFQWITNGRFLAWSPDGTRFCVARGRDTVAYDRRRDPPPPQPGETPEDRYWREHRLVWAAPLFVRAAGGGPMRQITPRLSWIIGADWRKKP